MGRRSPTDSSERRTATVTVQVTPSERADLDERIKAAGVRLSEYARAALLGYQLQVRNLLTERALSELWAIGNNLNQIARHANRTEQIDPEEVHDALRKWGAFVDRLQE